MIHLINELRRNSGREPIFHFDCLIGDYCYAHSLSMASENRLYHASQEYLNGWNEAVARCNIEYGNWENTCRRIIFDVLGCSEEHKNMIINASELGYGFAEKDGILYLTIRGR